MRLSAAQLSQAALPGQFVNIKVSEGCEPLLRRPFSIHRVDGSAFEILYETVGPATLILSQKKAGEYLDIIGPLGNGFDYLSLVARRSSFVLVAGGMGVAPLFFLAEKIREIPNPKSQIPNSILLGAKTKNQILCEKEFKKLGWEVKVATDDGSRGFKGKVTNLLQGILRTTNDERRTTISACGPKPMLAAVSLIAKQYKIPAQISLEEHMSCGIGACMGCIVRTKTGFKKVCDQGPVFRADEIIWP